MDIALNFAAHQVFSDKQAFEMRRARKHLRQRVHNCRMPFHFAQIGDDADDWRVRRNAEFRSAFGGKCLPFRKIRRVIRKIDAVRDGDDFFKRHALPAMRRQPPCFGIRNVQINKRSGQAI